MGAGDVGERFTLSNVPAHCSGFYKSMGASAGYLIDDAPNLNDEPVNGAIATFGWLDTSDRQRLAMGGPGSGVLACRQNDLQMGPMSSEFLGSDGDVRPQPPRRASPPGDSHDLTVKHFNPASLHDS